MIKVAGFQKNSFIDYPGKIASVIFLGGCNFACHYCHNSQILAQNSNTIDFDQVLNEIKERIGFIDGVVITGGEPTLHPDILEIVQKVKELGILVKLDTNGTNFEMLKYLVTQQLVNYVAMDIKAPLEKYSDIIGTHADLGNIKQSIDFLKMGTADYMFRTTLSPRLTENDIKQIGELISGAACFQLQQFVPNDFSNSHSVVHVPYPPEIADKFGALLSKYCERLVIRGF